MSSLLFFSEECDMCKKLLHTIKTHKLDKNFDMRQVEMMSAEDFVNSGIEVVPTIINNNFYYEREECYDFINGMVQYIKYSQTANMITVSENMIEDENEKCAICMGEFQICEIVHTFYCEHKFHKECSVTWRKTKNNCPCCGKSLVGSNK